MKLVKFLKSQSLRTFRHSDRFGRGWRARVKPRLKSSEVDIGIAVDALAELVRSWPEPKSVGPSVGELSPLDICVGPFWRARQEEWYVQVAIDFDAPCRDCLREACISECRHKVPETAAIEAAFEDLSKVIGVLSRFGLEVSGFQDGQFVQRDMTVVVTGRRGLELRFERLMEPPAAKGVSDLLAGMKDEFPTLDIGATRDVRRPRRAVLSQHPGDGAERHGLRMPLDPELAPESPSDWKAMQLQLVDWAHQLRSGDAPSESLPLNLNRIFGVACLPELEVPQKAPETWSDFNDRLARRSEGVQDSARVPASGSMDLAERLEGRAGTLIWSRPNRRITGLSLSLVHGAVNVLGI